MLNQFFQLQELVVIQCCGDRGKSRNQTVLTFLDKIPGDVLYQLSDEFFPADLGAVVKCVPLFFPTEKAFLEQAVQRTLYGIQGAALTLG